MRFQVAESRCKYGRKIFFLFFSPSGIVEYQVKGADKEGSLFIANNSQWRKVFFFFPSYKTPFPPLLVVLSSCTHVNDRGERGEKEKRGRGDEKESGEKREERSEKVRRVPPLMNAATSGHHVFPSLVRPTTKHPPARPPLADFPTPRQTAIEPLYTLVCASEEYILQTGGGARAGECNIDNNYATRSVCRITNRTRFFVNIVHRLIELVDS